MGLYGNLSDHFNNPEMSDRILVVKIRKDGWEKLEAARRVRSITKTNSQGGNDDTISTISGNQQEKPNKTEENESAVSTEEQKFDADELATTTADDSFKGTVSRESLQKYKSAKTHLQQWQATGSGAFS